MDKGFADREYEHLDDFEEDEGAKRIKNLFKNIESIDEERGEKKITYIDMQSGNQRTYLKKIKDEEKDGYKKVPYEIYHHFKANISKIPEKEITKLKKITDWAISDGNSLDEALAKIKKLEIELGFPRGANADRWDKIYEYIQMDKQIKELRQRQDAI